MADPTTAAPDTAAPDTAEPGDVCTVAGLYGSVSAMEPGYDAAEVYAHPVGERVRLIADGQHLAELRVAGRQRVALSPGAIAVLAGLVAPSGEHINPDGIFGPDGVWDELRAAFPVERFWDWANAHPPESMDLNDGEMYDPDAGE